MVTYRHSRIHLPQPWRLRMLALLAALLMPWQAAAQDTLALANGTALSLTACPDTVGVIVDDGGIGLNYSDNFEGSVLIHWPAGMTLSLDGDFETEYYYDYLTITEGSVQTQYLTGTGTLDYTSTSGLLTLAFHTDGSSTQSGFALTWRLYNGSSLCANPVVGLHAEWSNDHYNLLWDAPLTGQMIIDWGTGIDSVAASTGSYALTSLSPAQRYTVMAYLSGSTSLCCAGSLSLRTPCGTATLPYAESFEDQPDGSMPDCWVRIANFDDALTRPRVVSTGGADGTHSLMLSCGATSQGGHFGLVATPPIEGTGSRTTTLALMATHNNTRLVIGTLAANAGEYDTSSFVRLQTLVLQNEGQWVNYQIEWTSPADGTRLAFYMKQGMQDGTGRRVYIDMPQTAACGVDSVKVSHLTDTTALLSWNTFGSPTCHVGVRPAGQLTDAVIINNAVSPMEITGLNPYTYYTFTVYPDCAEQSGMPRSTEVRTDPAAPPAEGFCSGFRQSNIMPEGWYLSGFASSIYGCSSLGWDGYGFSMNKGCAYEIDDSAMIISPRLSGLPGEIVSVALEYYPYGSLIIGGTIKEPDDLTTFKPIDTIALVDNGQWTWKRGIFSFMVPTTRDDNRVALVIKNPNNATDVRIRGIAIGRESEVWPHVAHHRGTSIELRWDGTHDTVIVEYGYSGFDLGTGMRDTAYNASRITIDSLQPGTDYEFVAWVPRLGACNDLRIGGHTDHEDYPMPYCENFSDLYYPWGRWDGDWDILNSLDGYPNIGEHPYSYEVGRAVVMSSYGFQDMYYTTITLPDVEIDTGAVMSFYASSLAPQSRLVIGTYNDEYNTWFNVFDTIDIVASRTHYAYVLPDSIIDNEGRLALRWFHEYPYSFYQLYIDEINIDTAAYGHLDYLHVGFDTASFGLDTVIRADSVLLTLYGGGDTLSAVWVPADGPYGFGDLDSGTLYLVYISTYGDSGLSCPSYTGYIITHAYGGGGYSNCHNFESYLSYELPSGWYFLDSARIDGNTLVFDSVAITPPIRYSNGTTLNLRKTDLDTLYIGYTTDSTDFICTDTITEVTASLYLHDLPDTGAIIALRAADTCHLDMIGFTGCPIVDFTSQGGRLICTIRGNREPDYLLTAQALGNPEIRSYHITQSPFAITDMSPGTTYQIGYQCPSDINGCKPILSITIDDSITLPYCEQFEMESGSGVPDNWTFFYDEDVPRMLELGWGERPLRFGEWGRPNQMAVLPAIHHDGAMTVRLRAHVWSHHALEMGLVDGDLDTSTFVPMTFNDRYNDWVEMYFNLDSIGDRRIALRAYDLALIDWVSILPQPAMQVSLTTDHTIVISASQPDTLYVHYQDFWPTYYDSVITITSLPYTLQVRSTVDQILLTQVADAAGNNCGSSGDYYNMASAVNVPYCSMTQVTNKTYLRFGGRNSNAPWNGDFAGKGCYLFNSNYYETGYDFLIMPYINEPINGLEVGFSMYSTWPGDSVEVGILENAYDTGAFVPIGYAVYSDPEGGWQRCNVSLDTYTGNGRWIVFRHRGQPIFDSYGYLCLTEFTVSECTNMMTAATATASLYRWNLVRIDAVDTGFMVEYGPTGFTAGTGTIEHIDSLPYMLTLEAKTAYDIYFRCDSGQLSCRPGFTIGTLGAPLGLPMCADFDTSAIGSMPESWTTLGGKARVSGEASHSGTQSLSLALSAYGTTFVVSPELAADSIRQYALGLWVYAPAEGATFEVGTLSSPSDGSGFYPAATFYLAGNTWTHLDADLSQAPATAKFIALRAQNHGWYTDTLRIDDLNIASCAAFNLRAAEINPDNITLTWSQAGSPAITVQVVQDGDTMSTITPYAPPLTLYGLSPHSQYTFLFSSSCPDSTSICSSSYLDSVTLIMPAAAGDCVNPTDLYSPNAVFFSGTYDNPYSTASPIDFGPDDPASRHTVCTDTSARDPRTGNLLRTIPEGFTSSVRLGNWESNPYSPEAEGVIYSLFVDTGSFQLLLLRYAAVLQDPMHAPEDQPRFRLEVLDSAFNLIDPSCTSADFIADQSLGWNVGPSGVLWKDWTSVGIDLSAYADQQVYLRLTTYDCNEGSHYGYAYFTLECMRKALGTQVCGAQDSNTLTAPAGFNYRWYTSLSPTTIATTQSITIPTNDVTYFCDLSKIDNSSCVFTISAYGGTRYPMASFDTMMSLVNCHFLVTFINTSAVSKDNITPIPGEQCESAEWNFGNGQTSTSYHTSATYLLPGVYTVMLVSGIADDQCQDTFYMTLNLELPPGMQPTDSVIANICEGESYTFRGAPYSQTGTYYSTSPNPGQCDSLHTLLLSAWPATASDTVAIVCDSLRWRSTLYDLDGDYTVPTGVPNAHGCDSTRTLHLTVHYSDTTVIRDTVVQNDLPYAVAGTAITYSDLGAVNPALAATESQFHLFTSHGCDSLVDLHLTAWRNRDTIVDTTTCRNLLPLEYNGTSLNPPGANAGYSFNLQTTHGADSTVALLLHVVDNPVASFTDTVVENDLPVGFRGYLFNAAIDTNILLPGNGCDTLAHYILHVWPNLDTTLQRTVCRNQLPYTFDSATFTDPGADSIPLTQTYTDSITLVLTDIHGADSMVTYLLTVGSVHDTAETIVICPGQNYFYRGVDYGGPAEFDTMLYTIYDCDSAVHVILTPRDTNYRFFSYYHFNSEEWAEPDTMLLACHTATLHLWDTTPGALSRQWLIVTPDSLWSSPDSMATYTFQPLDTTAVAALIIESNLGCTDTLAWPVVLFPSPVANFHWDPELPVMSHPETQFINLSTYDTTHFPISTTHSPLTYLWTIGSPAGEEDTSTLESPYYSWGEGSEGITGDAEVELIAYWEQERDFCLDTSWISPVWTPSSLYWILLSATKINHTCTDTTTYTVTITNDYLQFPNLVTPNGDGKNDVWRIVNLVEYGEYPTNELWIYNQWGALVYHARNIRSADEHWDPNATNSPDGAYYYRFTARGRFGITKRNGLIEVLR